jgi:hypothetical protein
MTDRVANGVESFQIIRQMQRTHESCSELLGAIGRFLAIENYLTPYQLKNVQLEYDKTLKTLYKLQSQCLLNQAQFAIDQLDAAVAHTLATQSKESWWAFSEDDSAHVCVSMQEDHDHIIADAIATCTSVASDWEVMVWQRNNNLYTTGCYLRKT